MKINVIANVTVIPRIAKRLGALNNSLERVHSLEWDQNLLSIKYFFSRVGWLWANDVSVPRKVISGLSGWNFFVRCPVLIFLAAR